MMGHLHTSNCWGYILRQFHTVSQCIMGSSGSTEMRRSTSVMQSLCDLTQFYVLWKHTEADAGGRMPVSLVCIAKGQQRLNHTSNGSSERQVKHTRVEKKCCVWHVFRDLEEKQSVVEAVHGWMQLNRPWLPVWWLRPHVGQMTSTDHG